MELNNTPIRTSKNFNINNIKLDVEMPAVTENFKNIKNYMKKVKIFQKKLRMKKNMFFIKIKLLKETFVLL